MHKTTNGNGSNNALSITKMHKTTNGNGSNNALSTTKIHKTTNGNGSSNALSTTKMHKNRFSADFFEGIDLKENTCKLLTNSVKKD